MKTLITAALITLMSATAQATDLKVSCTVTENNDLQLETVIKPTLNGYGKIGSISGYSFRIRNNDGSRVSLEIFDMAGEARYYADATLLKAGDSVVNTIWRRDVLLEVSCQIPE